MNECESRKWSEPWIAGSGASMGRATTAVNASCRAGARPRRVTTARLRNPRYDIFRIPERPAIIRVATQGEFTR